MDPGVLATSLEQISQKLDLLLSGARKDDCRFVTITAAANYISLSTESVRRLLASGKLTALRPVRGRIVIDKRELEAFVLGTRQQRRTGRGLTLRNTPQTKREGE